MKQNTMEEACSALAAALMGCLELLSDQRPTREDSARLYSVGELAARFSKSKATIRRWMGNGDFGEIVQAGNTPLVTEEGLQKYIEDHSGQCRKRVRQPQRRNAARFPSAERI